MSSPGPNFTLNTEPPRQPPPQANPNPAIRIALLSWLLPLIALVAAPLFVLLHFALDDLRFTWWWLPLVVLLVGSLGSICYSLVRLPPSGQGTGRGAVLWQAVAGIVVLIISATVCACCAVPMSVNLYVKSDAGRHAIAAIKEQNRLKREQAQQLAAEAEKRQRLLEWYAAEQARQKIAEEKQSRQNEENERQRKQAADRARAEQYTKGLVERFTKGSTATALPSGQMGPVALDKFSPQLKVRRGKPIESIAQAEELVDGRLVEHGMSIRRLNLVGAELAPTAVFYQLGREWKAGLLRRDGRLLEISTTDWKQEQLRDFGGECCNLTANGPYLVVVRHNPGAIYLVLAHEQSNTADEVELSQPEQCTLSVQPLMLHVCTSGDPPLYAQLDSNYRVVALGELSRAVPAEKDWFAASLRGRDLLVDADGLTYGTRDDGVFRTRVLDGNVNRFAPKKKSQTKVGRLSLSGDTILFPDGDIYLPLLQWEQVVPADQIRTDVFARFGEKLLATCNDSTNLQIYDLRGKLTSSHAWPNVGKTLAVVGVRHLDQLLVFTEQRVFVVSPE